MPQGSGKTTKKVVKWCVGELPGYSGCDKFFFLFFWSMLFLCEMEIRLMPNWPSEWFWLKLNDFKVESHCSLRRINETCSSTHKRLPPSLPVVVGVDTDTPHLRQQWKTKALYNRVWKPWYLFCIIEKNISKVWNTLYKCLPLRGRWCCDFQFLSWRLRSVIAVRNLRFL